MNERRRGRYFAGILAVGMLLATLTTGLAFSQTSTPYQPKFKGDPARSESEAQALGYMRVVLRAEHAYNKKHGKYAESFDALVGTGTFTKRLAHETERGDYTVSFHPHKDGFVLTLTPKQMDSEHRSFYAEEDGVIHADDQKPADSSSPKVQ